MNALLLTADIRTESDVVFVRQRARQIAALLGFEATEQTRISTAVSEIARNTFQYALGGRVHFYIEGTAPVQLVIRISDRGLGIPNLSSILEGNYRSETGMGMGLFGSSKLMDTFRVDSVPGQGTTVELGKALPHGHQVTSDVVERITDDLSRLVPTSPMDEIRSQNADLLRAFDDLRARQLELDRMYRELADTNLRMTDVHAQLEKKAEDLERTGRAERAARAAAEAAVASRDEVLAIVSHELRGPLNSISLACNVLTEEHPADLHLQCVEAIQRSAVRCERLIKDLLAMAHIESGRLSLDVAPLDVRDLVQQVQRDHESAATAARSTLTVSVADHPAPMVGDVHRLHQVLSNLLANALLHARGGTIEMSVVTRDADIVIAVVDDGPGIPPNELPLIFDRYQQGAGRRGGAGLGLAIVKGLVEAHHGTVVVTSELGHGARFEVTLPVRAAG